MCVLLNFPRFPILCTKSSPAVSQVVSDLWKRYASETPERLKIVDAYLLYILLTGIAQFVYCCLVGTFPFNSFLAGFISTIGSFVLAGKWIERKEKGCICGEIE